MKISLATPNEMKISSIKKSEIAWFEALVSALASTHLVM